MTAGEFHGEITGGFATAGDHRIRRIVDRVRDHLDMDVVYLTQVVTGYQLYRLAGAQGDVFGMGMAEDLPLPPAIAKLVIEGDAPQVIGDIASDPDADAYGDVLAPPVGAFIGVPVQSVNGECVGSLCCVSNTPRPDLDDRAVAFMAALAEFLAEPLEAWESRYVARKSVKRLLETGAIIPALQPVVRLTDGAWVGVEALARFPAAGVTPDSAFSDSRDCGLDTELERAALDVALRTRPVLPDGVHLAFNAGPAAILSDGFAEVLSASGPLDRLVLEITEHAAVEEYENLTDVVNPLRRAGLRLAVDDVGAGYASLRHVVRMAPDIIKIDRSLVDGISRDVAQRSIVAGIVMLALDLGVLTVAEGVETAADAAALTELGVDMVQGYLFAPPSTDPDKWSTWETPWLLPGAPPGVTQRRTAATA